MKIEMKRDALNHPIVVVTQGVAGISTGPIIDAEEMAKLIDDLESTVIDLRLHRTAPPSLQGMVRRGEYGVAGT